MGFKEQNSYANIGVNGVLRLQHQRNTQELPGLHYTKHTKPTHSLYSLGEKLSFYVGSLKVFVVGNFNLIYREMFGTSEDEVSDLDHTEDSENGNYP